MGYLINTDHGGTIQAWNEVGDMEGFFLDNSISPRVRKKNETLHPKVEGERNRGYIVAKCKEQLLGKFCVLQISLNSYFSEDSTCGAMGTLIFLAVLF